MNRPSATLRKTYSSHESALDSKLETFTVGGANNTKALMMVGFVVGADGILVARDADADALHTTPVLAGQFWGLRLQGIDSASTCWPITLLYGPQS